MVKRVNGVFKIGDFTIEANRVSSDGFGVLLIFEPLNPKAERTHQRILTKLAYHLSLEIRKREGQKEVEP